ncbi:MAG: radical SAM protein [Sulfuritalea sp.]|nr:radical SAM protein [Sulfuritalea sp.]
MTAPQFLYLQVNKRCNLRCQHCSFWQLDDSDKDNYLPWSQKRQIIREFGELNPNGSVVICGGESMLDLEDYFAIAAACREFGLRSLSVVNGTRIKRADIAERMVREGPDEISVSLNSHREDLHDATRGTKGAFRLATQALRLLLAARSQRTGSKTRIYVMGLIFDQNYLELDAFYDFVLNEIGADKLKLNFLQPTFAQNRVEDEFFSRHHRLAADELVAQIRHCDKKYRLGLNPVWWNQVGMYFHSLNRAQDIYLGWGSRAGTTEHICNTYERNVMVDHYGIARLCFSPAFPGFPLAKPGDLRRFWEGAELIRQQMRHCNHYCGISHSVRRETSTLASRGRPGSLPPSR